jgi:hypothetical protein
MEDGPRRRAKWRGIKALCRDVRRRGRAAAMFSGCSAAAISPAGSGSFAFRSGDPWNIDAAILCSFHDCTTKVPQHHVSRTKNFGPMT